MRAMALILAVLLVLPGAAALELYYNLTMAYDNGEITLGSVSVVPLEDYYSEFYDTLNDYAAVVMGKDRMLGVYYFDFSLVRKAFIVKDGTVIDSYDIVLGKNTVSEYFPYNEEAASIIVRDKSLRNVLTVELKPPELGEEVIPEVKPKEKPMLGYMLIAVLILLVLVVMWIVLKKERE